MDKLKRDNDWLGVAIGLVFPATAFGLAMAFKSITHQMVTTPFLLIICVATNFIPVMFYSKHELDKTTRGLVLTTVFLGLMFFYYKLYVLKE
jgi:hypothetical protein